MKEGDIKTGDGKRKRKDAGIRAAGIFVLLLLVSCAGFVKASFSDELPTETIYVLVYFVTPPLASGTVLASNIEFEFTRLNVSDLPLNFSIGDFTGLRTVEYEVISWGAQGCAARVTCRYSNDVLNDTAEEQTDIIANHVLAMFNQLQLSRFFSQMKRDDSTGELTVLRDYGYFPDKAIRNVLAHKPRGGFSDLITEDFLNLYTDGDYISFVHLEYMIYRSSWDFNFGMCETLSWNRTNDIIHLDVNGMIAAGPIVASPNRDSKISLVLYKSYRSSDVAYSMSLDNIGPPNYTKREEDENTLTVTYDLSLTEPMQINAKVKTHVQRTEDPFHKPIIVTAGIVCLIGLVLVIGACLLSRKRRKSMGKVSDFETEKREVVRETLGHRSEVLGLAIARKL